MKPVNFNTKIYAISLSVTFLLINFNSCLAQDTTTTNTLNAKVAFGEFCPIICGQGSNDTVSARQISWKEGNFESRSFVFINKTSGQAIVAHSTNEVCLFKGKLYTVDSAGPSQAAFINVSQSFGTNEFSGAEALVFRARIAGDYYRPDSPHRKLINLHSLLIAEYKTVNSAIGIPLRHVELIVESGNLILLFESYTYIKGKVVLDDQLNPISMSIISAPASNDESSVSNRTNNVPKPRWPPPELRKN
jgi:hypothetical protein